MYFYSEKSYAAMSSIGISAKRMKMYVFLGFYLRINIFIYLSFNIWFGFKTGNFNSRDYLESENEIIGH